MIYKTCTACGANLDPGEQCDCTKKPLTENKAASTISNSSGCKGYQHQHGKYRVLENRRLKNV